MSGSSSSRRPSPEQIWADLRRATTATASGDGQYPTHEPIAAVLSCSDARVPPSIVFGQPAGQLFVVRVAGNSASPVTIASIDYAVGQLGVELVIVLGHTDCGAAHAAVAGDPPWPLEPVVDPLLELAKADPTASVDDIIERNVRRTMDVLAAHRGPTGRSVNQGVTELRGGIYDVRSGQVTDVT